MPLSSKVNWKVSPNSIVPLSKVPSGAASRSSETPGTPCFLARPDVTVCAMSSWLVHVTVWPSSSSMASGSKAKPEIVAATAPSACRGSLAVGSWVQPAARMVTLSSAISVFMPPVRRQRAPRMYRELGAVVSEPRRI